MRATRTSREALLRAFELRWEIEDGVAGAAADLDRLVADAERHGWADVVRVALYAAITRARAASRDAGRDLVPEAVEALRLRSEEDGDPTMLSIALTFQVSSWLDGGDPSVLVTADRELARATVLLEVGSGSPLERVVAHNRCASAHVQRGLWELADEQYSAAETLLPQCGETRYSAAIRFNRAEVFLDWACALREIEPEDAPSLRELCSSGLATVAAAKKDPSMPERWRGELIVIATLLAALAGEDNSAVARELLAGGTVSAEYEGHLHLAVALAYPCVSGDEAAREVELAVAQLDPADHQPEHELALRVAAELESTRSEGPMATAGMRYGQRQVEQRWGTRLSSLAAVQSLIDSERLVAEREMLRRDVFIDELTGLSNRRGFQAYVSGLAIRGVECVAVLMVDVDYFKRVNDQFGHAAGDETLAKLGRILAGSVRQGDNAARLGGDEFALVLAGADLGAASSRANVLLEEIGTASWSDIDPSLKVRASIGVAAGPPAGIDRLAAKADLAMYEAKAAGGGRSVAR